MSDLRVAVLIRCYQQGEFLAEALSSVMAQTRAVDEVVVVNDGSDDSTAAVAAEWAARDGRVLVLSPLTRLGPSRALNAASDATKADLLLPLDADDRLSEQFVERTVDALVVSGADVAYTARRLFGASDLWLPAVPFDDDELRTENPIVISSLFRRWIIDRVGGLSDSFDSLGLEDWDLWVSAAEMGAGFVAVDGCWLEYRQHRDGGRNSISKWTALRAHLLMKRRHPSMTWRHLMVWALRSARRNLP